MAIQPWSEEPLPPKQPLREGLRELGGFAIWLVRPYVDRIVPGRTGGDALDPGRHATRARYADSLMTKSRLLL